MSIKAHIKAKNQNIQEDAEYICRMLVEVLKIPVYFLDDQYNICFSFSYGFIDNPLHPSLKELFIELFGIEETFRMPIIKSTKYFENYFAVRLRRGDVLKGTFIIGPSTYSPITADAIDALVTENNIAVGSKRKLIHYYNTITVYDYTRLISASLLLYYCIYNVKLSRDEMIEKNSTLKQAPVKEEPVLESTLSKNRQNIFFHHSQIREKNIFDCLKKGDLENLIKFQQSPLDGEAGILSKNNPLRAHKNLVICSVTLATRAAMEGGMSSEEAYTLSDLYIQKIEESGEIKDLFTLESKMLYDFTKRVSRAKAGKHGKAVSLCQNYIFKNLYERVSLTELAEHVKLHPNYLSELFKKETGVTVSEYIQREKIEEAKRLLASSQYSLLDIANWLSFHDQSHFTRLFKKYEGITPNKYRETKYLL